MKEDNKTDCTCKNKEDKVCTCTDECNEDEHNCKDKTNECKCDHGKEDSQATLKEHKKGNFLKHDKNLDKLKEALGKISLLEDTLIRDKAELVNYRKRKDDEVVKMLKYANEDVIKEMLPIIDNFERAIKLDDADLNDELSKFLSGFKMIYCTLINVMGKYELKAIDGANKPFDPTYHEAVMTAKVDGIMPGIVIDVLQKGYLFKDKVIRPAMVRVSE